MKMKSMPTFAYHLGHKLDGAIIAEAYAAAGAKVLADVVAGHNCGPWSFVLCQWHRTGVPDSTRDI
jgi:hypothetical protein